MISTIDHRLFAALAAPHDLGGFRLFVAVAVARWTFLCAPVAVVLLWLFGQAADRGAAVAATLAGLGGLAIAAAVSSLIVMPRPFMDGTATNYLGHVRDSAFPSDHATLMFALAFTFWVRRPPTVPWLGGAALVLAIAVGWSRIYLGAHYPVDIAGAALIAAIATAAVASPSGQAAVERICELADRIRGRRVGRHGPGRHPEGGRLP